MSGCDTLVTNASAGAAPALRAVDCLTGEATSGAFAQLFGSNGALLPVLTLLLTIYIACFAIAVMSGRSRLGVRMLTERMLLVGFVLTFATSWLAYQSVVWNLAVGAPDQVASVLSGSSGAASVQFADRIDMVFAAIAEVASPDGRNGAAAAGVGTGGAFTPDNLVWLSAVLLMLGTLGVLVTSRIVMAVLLALGPLFVLAALFRGTRGLLSGWLRALALTALAPLFAVLGGSLSLRLIAPVVAGMREAEAIEPRAALALLLISAVHVALMVIVMRVAAVVVGAWTLPGSSRQESRREASAMHVAPALATSSATAAAGTRSAQPDESGARTTARIPGMTLAPQGMQRAPAMTNAYQPGRSTPSALPSRAMGIGSRFRAAPVNRWPQ